MSGSRRTLRVGIHAKIVDYLKEMNKGAALPLAQKAGAGLAAGGLGAIFGSPADLSLIRMQAGLRTSTRTPAPHTPHSDSSSRHL